MRTEEIFVMFIIASIIAGIGVLAYDRIKYRKYYETMPEDYDAEREKV